MGLAQRDFELLVQLSEKWMGSVFSKEKMYLFENRLLSMVRHFQYPDLNTLLQDLRKKGDDLELEKKEYFIDLITTHETLFFRDRSPFRCITEVVLPEFLKRTPAEDFKIYSAACSSGQEPVSLAILMKEELPKGRRATIFATDISRAVIDYAKAGVYTQYEVQRGLPGEYLTRHFNQKGQDWMLKPELLSSIQYRVENLLSPCFKPHKFDLVLCRNVTIYMDRPKVRLLYERIHAGMNQGAHLLIGHSERMADHGDLFQTIRSEAGTLYRKR